MPYFEQALTAAEQLRDAEKPQCTHGHWFIKKARKLFHIHGGNVNCSELVVAGVENEANARLIAAAPELLKALELLESMVLASGWKEQQCLAMARKAIAKAKGQSV